MGWSLLKASTIILCTLITEAVAACSLVAVVTEPRETIGGWKDREVAVERDKGRASGITTGEVEEVTGTGREGSMAVSAIGVLSSVESNSSLLPELAPKPASRDG